MALRSLGRVGVDVGSRVACTSRRRAATHSCSSMSSARAVSSLVGPGQGHFGRSRAPPCTPGSSGSSTQLFKLVETDLMSKELTRYESWDAHPLGLHCVEDVLAELTAATAERLAPATSDPQPSSDLEDSPSGATAPGIRAAEVLAAWGQGPRLMDEIPQAAAVQEGQGVLAPTADGEAENVGVEQGVEKLAIKRTYQPHTIKRKRKHGFLYRSKSRLGKKILKRRQEKGRSRLGI